MDSKHVLEWFRFGDMDLDVAEVLSAQRPQHLEIICYHCQQAAEKYLKGYLIYQTGEEAPRIHNLTRLCALCSQWNILFDEIKSECNALNPYGIQPKYPDEIDIDERLTKIALRNAAEIQAFAPLQEVRKELEEEAP